MAYLGHSYVGAMKVSVKRQRKALSLQKKQSFFVISWLIWGIRMWMP